MKSFPVEAFNAYDIRGRVPDQLNESIAWRIGYGFARLLNARNLVVGHDIRRSSPSLTDAIIRGITAAGCNAVNIGQCGTEEIYYATFAGTNDGASFDGGLCITASHNPKDYNGVKLVQQSAAPLSGDHSLEHLKTLVAGADMPPSAQPGKVRRDEFKSDYEKYLLGWVDTKALKPLRIVVNPGNGGAGDIVDRLQSHLPFEFIRLNWKPDGAFPKGVPNPLIEENRAETASAVTLHKADLGLAWDGDFDRCFFFDENGRFVNGYYLVGILAKILLARNPGAAIVHDPRLYWSTQSVVQAAGGHCKISRTGHAFIKQVMRKEDAVYGGEISAHHYFRDFAYCDNGTIPWLLLCEHLCKSDLALSQLVGNMNQNYHCSDELNISITNTDAVMKEIARTFKSEAESIETIDGLGVTLDGWRFSVRQSNTEPLLRVNVESRGDRKLLERGTERLLKIIQESAELTTENEHSSARVN